MQSFNGLSTTEVSGNCCLALGVFDGVHIGHQRLLRRVVEVCRATGLLSLALTFEPHPESILSPGSGPPLLTTTEEKLTLFRRLGIKATVVAGFDRSLADMAAREFTKQILLGELHVKYVVVGPALTFGKGGEGDVSTLKAFGEEMGFQVEVVDEVESEGEVVSSTVVRQAVLAGDMEKAARMLGRPYRLFGPVITGAGRGRELGFPTANLQPPLDKVLPPDGVYSCLAVIGNDIPELSWKALKEKESAIAAAYIGSRPTFGEGERLIEAYICGGNLQLYGSMLDLYFLSRLRGDAAFPSAEDLVRQMNKDAEQALKTAKRHLAEE